MKMDMSQYLDVFLEESKEHLENLNQKLLELEKNPNDGSSLNEIFRSAHTLKGMSSTMGFEDLADLTHHMEDILSDLKEGLLTANPYVVDALFKSFDRIQSIVEKIENGHGGESDNRDLIEVLDSIKSGLGVQEAAAVAEHQLVSENPGLQEAVSSNINGVELNEYEHSILQVAENSGMKIYALKIEIDRECLMKSVRAYMVFRTLEEDGEVVKSVPSAQEIDDGKFDGTFMVLLVGKNGLDDTIKRLNNISEVSVANYETITLTQLTPREASAVKAETEGPVLDGDVKDSKKGAKIKQTVRVDIERLDNLMNLVGELVMHKGRLEQIAVNRKIVELNEAMEQIDRISTDLQSVVMKVRMVPVEQVFNRFPRMVRDLSKELNKEVDFIIEGKETELDRTVIDEIGDPLIHLLRNAIDHGIEPTTERVVKGKPTKGTVLLRARHEGNNVYIEVEDDGGGINTERVLQKAVEKGLVDAKQAEMMGWDETIGLLFYPGFSTANTVTDVSGRGVGLDVVKSKIEALSGEIFVEARPGLGTRFRIKLPLTLAIIQALMIAVQDEVYAIPLSSVDETTMISSHEIKMMQKQEVIQLRGTVLPLYRLTGLLGLPERDQENESMYVVVVRKGDRQIGLVVDTLIGQQEIVIKSLGRLFLGIPGIAGAIVAGDGNVRLILDISTLF